MDGRYLPAPAASQPWRLRAVEPCAVMLMHGNDVAGNFDRAACLADVGALFVPLGSSHALTVNGVDPGQGTAARLAPGAGFGMHAHGHSVTVPAGRKPPVNGCWSLTRYNDKHLFHRNALNRCSVGTRNKNLKRKDERT